MNDQQNKRYALIATIISAFFTPFLAGAINISLPAIGEEFHMNSMLLGWVATSFLLSTVIFLVPTGRLADIYGRKRLFFWGAVIAILGCLMGTVSHSSWFLLLARVIQGMGSAMVFGTGNAILISVYPKEERGRALGMVIASVYLGSSLGPVLGGIMVEQFGWRSIFLFSFVALAAVPFMIKYKIQGEWAESRGEPYDLMGVFLFVPSVFCLMYGLSRIPDMMSWPLLMSGIIMFVLFVRLENKREYPLFQIRLFQGNTVFAMSNLAALLNYSASFAVGFFLSLYLQYIKALSAQEAGLVMFSQPILMAITSLYAGKLSDRYEPRLIASTGMFLTFCGLSCLIFINGETTLGYLIFCLLLLGLGFGLFSSPNTNAIMSSVEKKYLGVASSTVGTMRLIGQMISMGIAMTLFSIILGRVKIVPELYPQFLQALHAGFVIFACLCGLGIWASLKRGALRNKLR